MRQSERLREFLVQAQRHRNRPRHLGDFNGMSEPVAKMIAKSRREHLRLAFHTAKGTRMNHPIAIALKIAAIRMGGLGKLSAAQLCASQTEPPEHQANITWRTGCLIARQRALREAALGPRRQWI